MKTLQSVIEQNIKNVILKKNERNSSSFKFKKTSLDALSS